MFRSSDLQHEIQMFDHILEGESNTHRKRWWFGLMHEKRAWTSACVTSYNLCIREQWLSNTWTSWLAFLMDAELFLFVVCGITEKKHIMNQNQLLHALMFESLKSGQMRFQLIFALFIWWCDCQIANYESDHDELGMHFRCKKLQIMVFNQSNSTNYLY